MLSIVKRSRLTTEAGETRNPIDCELDSLVRRLEKIEARVGTRPARKGAEEVAVVTGDRFVDLKESIVTNVGKVRQWMAEANPTANPREQIEVDASIKRGLRDAEAAWHELEGVMQAESRRRSARSEDEIAAREETVLNLLHEIDDLKARHGASYATTGRTLAPTSGFEPIPTMEDFLEGAKVAPGEKEEITEDQKIRLQKIRARNAAVDATIGDIDKGIDVLADIANQQNQEARKQAVLIDDLEQHIDNVHEHLENVNAKMKVTLEKLDRGSDKLCVDLICIMVLIGMVVVMYKLMAS